MHNYQNPVLEGLIVNWLVHITYTRNNKKFYSQEIDIIDSASQVALHIKDVLTNKQLLAHQIQNIDSMFQIIPFF